MDQEETPPIKTNSERALFCPNGCNILWSTKAHDECAACGSIMTPNNEEAYYDRLVAAGQLL